MRILRSVRGTLSRLRLKLASPYSRAELLRRDGARIGTGCRLLSYSLGSEPWLVSIGDDTLVSHGVEFITHDGGAWVVRDRHPRINAFGRVSVGRRCFIGANSMLLPGTVIGDRSVVGAGAVVRGRFAPGSVIAGVPARVIGTVDEYETKLLGRSLDLPDECFPLDGGDRSLLRTSVLTMIETKGE